MLRATGPNYRCYIANPGVHSERKTMLRSINLLTIPAAVMAMFAMAACDRRDDQTVGQSVDRGIAAAQSGMNDAKEAARDAAGGVRAAASDATITGKVNAALIADDQLKAMKIDVDTKGGKVVLTGSAPNAETRDRATSLARAVEGVVDVENRLAVESKG
jgi:hyperosmotically inducible periplasmic protein